MRRERDEEVCGVHDQFVIVVIVVRFQSLTWPSTVCTLTQMGCTWQQSTARQELVSSLNWTICVFQV